MFIQMYEEKYMRFPGGKSKAVTFSYDDGVKADLKLLEIFGKYNLKGTFNLNNMHFNCPEWHGRMDEEQTYSAYSGSGQEIAVHGARHIFLDKVPLAEAVKEITLNRIYLEGKFGKIVRGMAYAYNSYTQDILNVLPALGIEYARTTESSYSFDLPENWLLIKPTCHHGDGKLSELTQKFLNDRPENSRKHREPWLFYIWGHSYEFDDNGNWDIIENLGKELSSKGDIWFATNGEIYDYVQAYKRLIWAMDGERVKNPSANTVYVEIRGKVYEIAGGREILFK